MKAQTGWPGVRPRLEAPFAQIHVRRGVHERNGLAPFPACELAALLLVEVDGTGSRGCGRSVTAASVTGVTGTLGQEAPGAQHVLDVAPITAREAGEHRLSVSPIPDAQAGLAVVMGGTAAGAVAAVPATSEGLVSNPTSSKPTENFGSGS